MMKGRLLGYALGFVVAGALFAPAPLLEVFRSVSPDPHLAACRANLEAMAQAVRAHTDSHDGELPQSLYQLVPESLPTIPACPAAGELSYRCESGLGAGYGEGGPESFLVICSGGYHEPWTSGRFPAYDSTLGFLVSKPVLAREHQ